MRSWLRKIREESGMTHDAVAMIADISRPYYTRIENGEHDVPVSTAKAIAKALDFDWQRFYEEETA